MSKTIKALLFVVGLIFVLGSFSWKKDDQNSPLKEQNFKGVWVATLNSMDFPSALTSDPQKLKDSADSMLKNVKELGFNAIFFQVRPSGDAFYSSDIFPWSKFLTGTQGVAPDDGFDPLSYIVAEAHKEDISVHAWINPYRITASKEDSLSENSIAKKHPHLVKEDTDGKLYLDPGHPDSRRLVLDGIQEILENYDVDGIHMDDYFYPSPSFPDNETFLMYGGDFLDIGDWRRNNTYLLVKEIKEAIDHSSRDVLFSVSPSGIWANKSSHADGSNTSGKQAYYDHYADTRLWVKEDLVDIIIPQLYWNIGYEIADFEELSNWWDNVVNDTQVSLLVGQGVYKIDEEGDPLSPWYKESGHKELENQLAIITSLKNSSGFVQYRLGSILKDPSLKEFIKNLNASGPLLFSDINECLWAKDSIESLFKKGVITGMGDGSFGARRNVSRADFIVMLMRLSKQNVPFTQNFSDVSSESYYYKEVGTAKALGFVTGREDNIFDPLSNITREDMATLVWRMLLKEGRIKEGTSFSLSEKFSDASQISEYARTAVSVMAEKKIISGYEDGNFRPKNFATRAECAVILDRVSKMLY